MNITRLKTLMSLKYFLHFIVIITILSFGCTQKIVTNTPFDVTKLNENKTYIKLTLETNSFLQYLSETAKANSLNMPDVIKSLNNIREKNLSFDNQMIEIDRIYKTNVSKRLLSHMKIYSETWPEINKIYKNLSKQILESESTEILYNNLNTGDELQIKSNNTDNLSTNVFYLLKDSYTIVKAISDMKTEKTMALIELLDHTRLISPGELMKMGK